MNQFKYAFIVLLCIIGLNTSAQVVLNLNSSKNEFTVLEKSPYKLKAKTSLDKVNTMNVTTSRGNFIELGLKGYSKIYDAGKPQLPVMSKLIEIPYGSEVRVKIISYNEQEINFADIGITDKIIPAQPSVSKSSILL
ncbi:MAG: C25 family peptidase propeptide domain-containing protein [Bacteroidota bacterium]